MKRKIKLKKPVHSSEVPATAGMLYHVEERLTHKMNEMFHGLKAEIHRVGLIVEEQNARNKFVMDGYTQMYEMINEKFNLKCRPEA